jgi:2-polyprenyl-3-methyl-5-hydroxy-6-metoxy-1,4-benzoquinol methylase
MKPEEYEAWYQTPRGRWISDVEFRLMQQVLKAEPGQALLDAGCGTGHFSRRLAGLGLRVTGIDPDAAAIEFAAQQNVGIDYLIGSAWFVKSAQPAVRAETRSWWLSPCALGQGS